METVVKDGVGYDPAKLAVGLPASPRRPSRRIAVQSWSGRGVIAISIPEERWFSAAGGLPTLRGLAEMGKGEVSRLSVDALDRVCEMLKNAL